MFLCALVCARLIYVVIILPTAHYTGTRTCLHTVFVFSILHWCLAANTSDIEKQKAKKETSPSAHVSTIHSMQEALAPRVGAGSLGLCAPKKEAAGRAAEGVAPAGRGLASVACALPYLVTQHTNLCGQPVVDRLLAMEEMAEVIVRPILQCLNACCMVR